MGNNPVSPDNKSYTNMIYNMFVEVESNDIKVDSITMDEGTFRLWMEEEPVKNKCDVYPSNSEHLGFVWGAVVKKATDGHKCAVLGFKNKFGIQLKNGTTTTEQHIGGCLVECRHPDCVIRSVHAL